MRCARLKWRFRLSLCPSWKGFCWLGYKTLNFNFSFFLSFFFLSLGKNNHMLFFKDTSSIIYSYEKKSV